MNKSSIYNPLKLWKPISKAIGNATVRNPNKVIKWTSRIGGPLLGATGIAGGAGYMLGKMKGNETLQGVGSDAAEVMLKNQLANMPSWQRELVAMDPSIAMVMGEQKMPGLIKSYEQQTGKPFKPGVIGSVFNQNDAPQQYVYTNSQGGNSYI